MRKAFVIALVLLGLGAGPAAALDVKDIRSTYGPFGGARPGNNFLPGDVLWLAFQIDDLAMEADTGLVKYKVKIEVTDSKDKIIFSRDTPNQRHLSLGKGQISERAQVVIGTEQAPGKYTVRLTVTDQGGGKEKGGGPSKSFTHDFEILAPDFGLIHAWAPSVAVTNQEFTAFCKLVGMARDAKQFPNVSPPDHQGRERQGHPAQAAGHQHPQRPALRRGVQEVRRGVRHQEVEDDPDALPAVPQPCRAVHRRDRGH